MTSFAFIKGVLPLVFSSGAGAELRHATFFVLVLAPVFYVALQLMIERRAASPQLQPSGPAEPAVRTHA